MRKRLLSVEGIFLFLGAAASAVSVGCDDVSQSPGSSDGKFGAALVDHDVAFDFSLSVVRKDDFLVLKFDFLNLVPDPLHQVLQRKQTGAAFIVVTFPSQHVFEAAFLDTGASNELPTQLPVGSRLSGPSRVAFVVPNTVANIPLTLEGLLQIVSQLDMSLAVNALPVGSRLAQTGGTQTTPITIDPLLDAGGGSLVSRVLRAQRDALAAFFFPLLKFPTPPADPTQAIAAGAPKVPFNVETSIELPFRLLMSPDIHGAWAHSAVPVTNAGQTELWHTRLGVRNSDGTVDEVNPAQRKMRALWTRDPGFNPDDPLAAAVPGDQVFPETTTSIEVETIATKDRAAIVDLTSNFERYTTATDDPLPRPVQTNLLMLSAMGGWLDVKGSWPDSDLVLADWEHRATFGRDHYVRLVFKGVLYPFGHRASLIEVSERKFKPEHPHTAYLRKRFFIVVQEPEKLYTDGRADTTDPDAVALRGLPFMAIKVKTLVTPTLDIVSEVTAFVPRVNGTRDTSSPTGYSGGTVFRFAFEAMDLDGNLVHFTAPVAWVEAVNTDGTPDSAAIGLGKSLYDVLGADLEIPLAGQRFAYAESSQPDDTTHETQSIIFDSQPTSTAVAPGYPHFVPVLAQTKIALEAVRHTLGTGEDATRTYQYHTAFLQNGFNAGNAGEVLLAMVPGQTPLQVSTTKRSDRSGGFVAPDFQIQGVSRKIGPVAGGSDITSGADAINGQFNPTQFFGGMLPVLFGIIPFTDILKATGLDRAPKYFTQILTRALGILADLEKLETDLTTAGYLNTVQPMPAIETLLSDVTTAFDASSSGQAAAAARIPADVNAVVSALANVSTVVPTLTIKPAALKADLVARAASLASSLPGTVTDIATQIANLATGAEFPKEIHTRLEWRGAVQASPLNVFVPDDPDSLYLVADIRASAQNGGSASIDLTCSLENFHINLITADTAHFLTLYFKNIQFRVLNGQKPDISVDLTNIEFDGPLKFIETLKKLIPLSGFSDPPNLTVDATGIRAGFTIGLPNLAVGVFSLENINLGAELHVPFIGPPLTFSFDFSTRENPFNLTVALLGGGGFFGLVIDPHGVQMLEASLEAGARISVDLGVASGSVSAMIGVYFRMETKSATDTDVQLTGYFNLRGQLDVLGLITVSVELSLSLTYDKDQGKLVGRASIEVDIDILFFSASVTVSCERKFAGSNGDPTFLDVMAPAGTYRPWDEYLAAFAA